jgi:MscS family membrane protein
MGARVCRSHAPIVPAADDDVPTTSLVGARRPALGFGGALVYPQPRSVEREENMPDEIHDVIEIGREYGAAWMLGVAIAAATYLVLAFARRMLVSRLEKGQARAGWSNGLRQALIRTSPVFLLVLAVYAGAFFVTLPPAVERVIQSALVIALFLQGALWASDIVVGWISWYAASQAERNRAIANALNLIQLFARVVVWTIALLLILNNLGFDVTALVAGLGIGGIAIALAAQNILSDLFASLAIVLDQPFVVGDFVILGDEMGTVERIGIKTTRIRSLSGEELIISNADLLASRIHNFKRMAERRVVFTIGVTYETPADKVERLPDMLRAIVEAQKLARFERAHFARFGDFALIYEVVYWMRTPDYNAYMDTQQRINITLYRQLAAEGVELALAAQAMQLQQPVRVVLENAR